MIVDPPGLPVTMNTLPSGRSTIVGDIEDSGRLPGADRIGRALHQPEAIGHAGLRGEIVHLVVEEEAGVARHLADAEQIVERIGHGHGIALRIDHRIMRGVGALGRATPPLISLDGVALSGRIEARSLAACSGEISRATGLWTNAGSPRSVLRSANARRSASTM